MSSALHNADNDQAKALKENSDQVMAAKHTLINLLNDILNQDFTANDKIVFSQEENGDLNVTTE